MKSWLKSRGEGDLTVQKDRYGYAIQDKPRIPLQRWFERLIAKASIPEDQQRVLEDLAQRGHVVYAVRYRSQLDLVYLTSRLHQLGLHQPSFVFDLRPYLWQPRWYALKIVLYHLGHLLRQGCLPNPYDDGYYRQKVKDGHAGLLFLVGKKGYYRRTILVGNDPLEHLIEIQREADKPIFVVPFFLLYSRAPGREKRRFFDLFFGSKEEPGFIRKFLSFLRGYPDAVLEAGEPLNLQDILPELSDILSERRKQVFQLRRELIESIDKIKRAVVGPTLKSTIELKEIILHHPRLEAYMQRRARSTKQEIWKVRMEADKYLDEIAATYSYTMVQIGERLLSWIWNNLFDGIEVDGESLQRLKKAARSNTLVYVPCHKSHTDYLILSYILYRNNLFTPFVAAGKNLAFWPLGPIFRRGGAFFIRRSFKGMKFYAEVFSLYVKTLVQLGHNIEFFIEGGRSRTGKMVLPKLGLLAILVQAVEEGFCDDLVFVPTAICYDRIPEEEAYLKEVSGGAKVDESIGQLVRARRFLKMRYGRVYVRFAEPVSLQRYLEKYRNGAENMRPKERHAMYRDFSYRVINSINKVSLVTPHSLAAAALLTTSRHGISLIEFREIYRTFYDYLMNRGVELSKTFRNYDASLEETLYDFEKSKLVGKLKDEDDDLEEEVFTMEDSKRLALEYYKNNLIHFLLPAAYVSTSILAQQTFRFGLAQIVEDIAFMKNFFKYEFVYDNEVRDEELMEGVLQAFTDLELLHRVGQGDQPYILAHRGLRAAYCFHGLLRNYFEGYWLVLRAFRYFQKKPYSERDFMKKVMNLSQKALKLQLIERPESMSRIMYANALKFYLEKGVIEKRMGDDKSKDKEQEWYADAGNRHLVQYYSREIGRLMRSPHLALQ
ncbi:MAG: hypothetical protein GX443_03935 [Deltaproteobacteria bacterium]|nr:hypothetical protein [Deltaproteobacteria bacterium]